MNAGLLGSSKAGMNGMLNVNTAEKVTSATYVWHESMRVTNQYVEILHVALANSKVNKI